MAGKQKYSYDTEEWNRGQSDGRPSNWSPVVKKKESTNLRDRGYPSSTNPSSQPKKKNQNPKATTSTTYAEKTKADYYRGQEAVKNPNAKTVVDSSGNKYTPSEYKARQAYLKDRHESKSSPAKTTRSVLEAAFKPTGSVREANSTSSKSKVTGSVRNTTSSKPSGTVRDAGTSQKKGSWNAEEEMRKRREAAMAKKKRG